MISRIQPWENTLLDGLGVVEACRKGGNVKRFHTHSSIIGEQTVAQHTFNMMTLCMALHPKPSRYLLFAILTHDLGEAATGDVPSPAKWANDALRTALDDSESRARAQFFMDYDKDLGDVDKLWVRFCDYFEGAQFARDQIVLGNRSCQIVFELYIGTLGKLKQEWEVWEAQYGVSGKWPEDLEVECLKLIQHYTTLTGQHIEWMK